MLIIRKEIKPGYGYISAVPSYGDIYAVPINRQSYGQIAVTPASFTNYIIYGLLGAGSLVGLYFLSKRIKKS